MCRYGFNKYKLTYACFQCQVGFKRSLLSDVKKAKLLLKYAKQTGEIPKSESVEFKCPNCRNEMANLGRDLRLPSKTKNEQWRCLKYLFDHKYNFYSCGCYGIGIVPHKMQEAIDLIQNSIVQLFELERRKNIEEKASKLKKIREQKMRNRILKK
jgi:predicted RNA-binding Zn-ribbon protein involved in translation (DUF1610 family)